MKRIHKKEEKYSGRYRTFLLSDQNIYHAVYSLRSYIFDFELLRESDKKQYYRLQDKFDETYIKGVIQSVRDKITDLIDKDDSFIETEVYFRPKKFNNERKVEYRPLHTADIVSQIAIVAMMHLLVYEIADNERKLYLSNISRLLPGNFYGNRVSLNPEVLFKPWKQQYQAYTQNANEALKKYNASLEYKYEVSLDLENFFPTIDPMLVYQLIVERLPVNMENSDKELLKRILIKLLFCKLKTRLSDKLKKEYYKIKGKEGIPSLKESFVRGIPQGLPQSYFFGNICMIPISEIFQKKFQGISYFYVDDSVIFTNDVKEDKFGEQLEDVNAEIEKLEKDLLKEEKIVFLPQTVQDMRELGIYGIHVHGMDEKKAVSKSGFTRLDQLDESEIYLKCVSREVSEAGNEIYKIYSDEEDIILEERMRVLSNEIQKKIEELNTRKILLEKELIQLQNISESEQNTDAIKEFKKQIQSLSKFRDRWIRYYRFFEYRKQRLNLRHVCELDKRHDKELEEIIYCARKCKTEEEKLKVFMQSYNENIWDAAVSMYCDFADDKAKEVLGKYIGELNWLCFGEENEDSSYLYKVYEELIESKKGENCNKDICKNVSMDFLDPYRSLKYYAAQKLKEFSHKHYDVAERWVEQIQKKEWKNEIVVKLLSENMIKMAEIVNENTPQFLRMSANAVYSQLFNVEIEDRLVVRKFSRKPLSCGEFRILLFLRNRLFTAETFLERKILLSESENKEDLDYAVMEVIEIFQSFVADPIRIDKLILTHQYTYGVWKNGSKHLYFYTLHNQEHAIALIRNIVKLIHGISFLKISALDFYVLFLACYLHDISMVKIPSLDAFLTDKEEGDSIAWEHLQEVHQEMSSDTKSENEEKLRNGESDIEDIAQIKKWMTQSYRRLDAYYEKKIREKHASDSAAEIRGRTDLRFLDATLREFVAEVSEAHQADERDIYFTKSLANEKVISLKFDKILLRLADLLDMSNCRISRPILYHNLDQMSEESAFHWISHLLTQGYELRTEYNIAEDRGCLTPKSIVEKLVLTVIVDMSQMSKCQCKEPCQYIEIGNIDDNGFELKVGKNCENGKEVCNFLCRWFSGKNQYLIQELFALKEYLNRVPDNYFGTEVLICIKIANRTCLDEKQFGILERYLR
ncbi:hypothetical protein IMSAGC002_00646 [Lachnospiraceae bacterium]|jgi:hypothetical protein|nr:hypothetical protein [Lachnospiraceae bacterium]GFH89401.1 hypothetical protein IMSAGC002_00646 [Lachnospiraceae bacterium]